MTKASNMSLKDLILFSNEEDFFKDRRMILTSVDAWGMLCKDLIVALGIERAKPFLLRYGWQLGMSEAQYLKEMFTWDDDLEWILAGSKMHNIAGRVFSTPEKLNINIKEKIFDVEGYWINSFEALQYLKHFPLHYDPVCYFLVGYASGYNSEAFGEKIVFKEVECVAKGDPQCRYVGKSVKMWGAEISEDLLGYEQERMEDELDRAYKRIEKQKEVLDRLASVSQEMTRIILQGKGLDDIAKLLNTNLHCGVIIENQQFEQITGYGQGTEYSLKKAVEHLKSSQPQQYAEINKMIKERSTIQVEIAASPLYPYSHLRLITPIVVRNQVVGTISLLKFEGEFGEIENVIAERSANICAIQMLTEWTVVETEQRLKGELLDELLNSSGDSSSISRRLAYLGHNLTEPHYVFVFQFKLSDKKTASLEDHTSTPLRDKAIDLLKKQVELRGFRLLISTKLDRIHALIPQALVNDLKLNIKEYGIKLINDLGISDGIEKVVLGISDACDQLSSYSRAFKEAVKATEIANAKNNHQNVMLSTEIRQLSILLDARKPEELEKYAYQLLGSIYEYDNLHNTELLKTVYYYFENECNLHKTSREMNVSISGLRYRLNRINLLSDLDLSQSTKRFEVQLALEIFIISGKISIE